MMPAIQKQNNKPTVKKPVRQMGGSVSSRIVSVGDLPDTGVKMLIYGRSKTGKTSFACSAPKKLLIISAEVGEAGGTKSVHNMKGVDYVQLQNPEEMRELVHDACLQYETVVVDTATSFESLVMAHILGIERIPEQKSWGMASREDYGKCGLQVKTYLRELLDLPNNTIVLAQERNFGDDKNTESDLNILPTIGAGLQPATAGWLNCAVDYIGGTYIRRQMVEQVNKVAGKEVRTSRATGRMEYCLRVGPDPIFTTGFRRPKEFALADVIVDPTFDMLKKLISGK